MVMIDVVDDYGNKGCWVIVDFIYCYLMLWVVWRGGFSRDKGDGETYGRLDSSAVWLRGHMKLFLCHGRATGGIWTCWCDVLRSRS